MYTLHYRHHHPHQFRMPVQLQVQHHIQSNGRLCTPDQRQQEEEVHPETPPIQGMAAILNGVIQAAIHQEEALDQEEALGQEERARHRHLPHQEEVQAEVQDQVQCREGLHPSRQEEEQELQGLLHLHLQALHNHHDLLIHGVHLDRSRKALPKLMLPSNYKACSILEMRQLLESWYDRCTFAIATWRGDAQRYWLDEILDHARTRHDQWLQSTPSQRASLEPAYILGDRKHIPEAKNAVESVLRTELLDAIPKSIADACMRHGYCTAELIAWYVMKQLILPQDINEVTMQRELLTPPKVTPSTLDQGCVWLEEMQYRLNLCMKTGQQVHPRTIITFVQEVLSGITQYYRTVGQHMGYSLSEASATGI